MSSFNITIINTFSVLTSTIKLGSILHCISELEVLIFRVSEPSLKVLKIFSFVKDVPLTLNFALVFHVSLISH